MTSPRERVLTALKRNGTPDRTPFEISWGAFTPLLMKTYREKTGSELPPEEYFDFDTRSVFPGPTRLKTDFTRFFPDGVEPEASFDEWGIGSVPTLYEIPDFKYHPLGTATTVAEIDAYPWPDFDAPYRYEGVRTQVATFHKRGYAVCSEMYQTLFETAWLMRDMQAFLMDMMLNEELTHAICERIAQIRVGQARQYALAGVDILRLGDDIVSQQGLMFSKELYNTYFKPRIKRIVAAAKEVNPDIIIFMHSCGKIEGMIDELIDAGVEVLNTVQPECNDQQAIKRTYGDRLSFWGGVGVQSVLPHGTPDEVRAATRKTIATLGPENGFLVAPAHILDPAIPWENIEAFIETVKEQR